MNSKLKNRIITILAAMALIVGTQASLFALDEASDVYGYHEIYDGNLSAVHKALNEHDVTSTTKAAVNVRNIIPLSTVETGGQFITERQFDLFSRTYFLHNHTFNTVFEVIINSVNTNGSVLFDIEHFNAAGTSIGRQDDLTLYDGLLMVNEISRIYPNNSFALTPDNALSQSYRFLNNTSEPILIYYVGPAPFEGPLAGGLWQWLQGWPRNALNEIQLTIEIEPNEYIEFATFIGMPWGGRDANNYRNQSLTGWGWNFHIYQEATLTPHTISTIIQGIHPITSSPSLDDLTVAAVAGSPQRFPEVILTTTETTNEYGHIGEWHFNGWEPDTELDLDDDGYFLMPDHDVVFIGTWTFNPTRRIISFYVGGDSPYDFIIPPSSQHIAGSNAPIPSTPVTEATYNADGVRGTWIFHGWTYEIQSDVQDTLIIIGDEYNYFQMPDADVIFSGHWAFVPDNFYVVRYLVPEDGIRPINHSPIPENQSFQSGSIVTVAPMLTSTDVYHNGVAGVWTFQGWATGDGIVENDTFIMPSQDVTFTGIWIFTPNAVTPPPVEPTPPVDPDPPIELDPPVVQNPPAEDIPEDEPTPTIPSPPTAPTPPVAPTEPEPETPYIETPPQDTNDAGTIQDEPVPLTAFTPPPAVLTIEDEDTPLAEYNDTEDDEIIDDITIVQNMPQTGLDSVQSIAFIGIGLSSLFALAGIIIIFKIKRDASTH